MSSIPNAETALTVALTAMPATPSPSQKTFDFDFTGSKYEMDASVTEEERRFYLKVYPTVDLVNQRKVHCTVCRMHIGTAARTEPNIKMHPILRVTHCIKCHDFYNSGEFSKGEDGSELYCRWCGQGGEVYCCSTCPFVFCKSCIIQNLSRGVIDDIEQNENWNCFKCTSKILWPLRAQHWAHVNYIQTQKNALQTLQLSESELRREMQKDYSTCCRPVKAKANSLSDSLKSLEPNASKRSHGSSVQSVKKSVKPLCPPNKRHKSSNDEVVCTPDLLSMLEPDCQISVAQKPAPRSITPAASISSTTMPRIVTVQQNYSGPSPSNNSNGSSSTPGQPRSSLPPPLVLSSSGVRYRQAILSPASVVSRTVVPNAIRTAGPVFHTINGFRVDLNSAAQQDSYRLPNGRLIQVKRQLPPAGQPTTTLTRAPIAINPQVIIRQQPATGQSPRMAHPNFSSNIGIYNPQTNQQQRAPQVVRANNGSQLHSVNISAQSTPVSSNGGTTIMMTPSTSSKGSTLVRHVFANSSIGTARSQLQDQIFNAMDICTHLTGKVQTLTHSNAYTQARSYMDLKELYIHLSYLMTYAIGRFKQLQDKCLVDMREMGFKNDANSLENGQLAADKQASDDEDNEIEIVEPKTDTITIDSDNDEESPSVSKLNVPRGLKITSVKSTASLENISPIDKVTANTDSNMDIDVAAFSSSILASLLEVDISEGPGGIKPNQKKQPRKKTTNKPNPALLHLERQRMEETKRTDPKLKMKVVVNLSRAEDDFEVARKWIDAKCNKNAKQREIKKHVEKQTNYEESPNKAEHTVSSVKDQSMKEKIQYKTKKETESTKIEESDNIQQVDSNISAAEDQEIHCDDNSREKMNTSDEKTANRTKSIDAVNELSIGDNLKEDDNHADNKNLSAECLKSKSEQNEVLADIGEAMKEIKSEVAEPEAMDETENFATAEAETPSNEPMDFIENIVRLENQRTGDETETNEERVIDEATTDVELYMECAAEEGIKKEDSEELDAVVAASVKTDNTTSKSLDSIKTEDDEEYEDATSAECKDINGPTDEASQADDPTESGSNKTPRTASPTTESADSSKQNLGPPKEANVLLYN